MQGSHWLPEMTGRWMPTKNRNNAVGIGQKSRTQGHAQNWLGHFAPATPWQTTLI